MPYLNSDSRILITGGTGSFGKALVSNLLKTIPDIKKIVVFSRDELKQWELQQIFPPDKYPQLRFFIGCVRDRDRLKRSLEGIDTIVHAAALKQVPTAEYNPMEFVKTNILGAENIIETSFDMDVRNVVALSTDKAASPINLYGATKLVSDKLFVSANNVKGSRQLRLSVVRYGNVLGSRGSVVPYFLKEAHKGVLPITDPRMTRFNITLDQGVSIVKWALNNSIGGEIFVPKLPSYKILDVAEAIAPDCKIEYLGLRPGEKIHEEMITISDSKKTYELEKCYAILPNDENTYTRLKNKHKKVDMVHDNFSYNSKSNTDFLTIKQIRELIKDNINKDFEPIILKE